MYPTNNRPAKTLHLPTCPKHGILLTYSTTKPVSPKTLYPTETRHHPDVPDKSPLSRKEQVVRQRGTIHHPGAIHSNLHPDSSRPKTLPSTPTRHHPTITQRLNAYAKPRTDKHHSPKQTPAQPEATHRTPTRHYPFSRCTRNPPTLPKTLYSTEARHHPDILPDNQPLRRKN